MNIAAYLPKRAESNPYQKAVIYPVGFSSEGRRTYVHQTFRDLNQRSDQLAAGMSKAGFQPGMKVLLMAPVGSEFVELTFAMFKLGLVPVLIDPGMGKTNLLECIASVEPQAMIAIEKAHLAKLLYRNSFKSIKLAVTVGRKFLPRGIALKNLYLPMEKAFELARPDPSDMAAIVFTTGSTGPPKGVVYFHEQMEGQVRSIQKEFKIDEKDVDFPIFPLFVLFSTAWGIPAVIPDLDPTRPAEADPRALIQGIEDHGVTVSIGSPAVWDRLGQFCSEHKIKLPSLKKILMVGAPVRPEVLKRYREILGPQGDTYTPYGATEALPVCNISGSEVLSLSLGDSEVGRGTCVGRPFPGIQVAIILLRDEPIQEWDSVLELKPGEMGEVCVKGPQVTREYYNLPDATRLAKIAEGDSCWHRMGDLGYLDDLGRLWFCGRKNHRVQSSNQCYYSVCTEAIFNLHPRVARSALVGIPSPMGEEPLIVIEPLPHQMPQSAEEKKNFLKELTELAVSHPQTQEIDRYLFHPAFPVDIRHQAKIFREQLRDWAIGILKRGNF
jgi:olefin beta-lactone synthetase